MYSKKRLLITSAIILVLGLTTIWSTVPNLFWVQLTYLGIAVVVFLIFSRVDTEILFSLSKISYIFSIGLLILTLLVGDTARGSTRWIYLGPLSIQSSEIIKPLLAIFFADFLSRNNINDWLNLGKYGLLSLVPIILIKIQPDLGSALVIVFMSAAMAVFAGLSPKKISIFILIFCLCLPLAPFILKDYQIDRLESFINPYHDPKGKGYNVIQSVIAVGSGGLLGKGVKLGTQSHLNFLPERHTDFVFASFSEEFGLLGIILVLGCYYFLLTSLLNLSFALKRQTESLLAFGIFLIFFFQIIVNIGMNLGIMPVTGITLPLFSYGGSSLTSFALLLGFSYKLLELTPKYRL